MKKHLGTMIGLLVAILTVTVPFLYFMPNLIPRKPTVINIFPTVSAAHISLLLSAHSETPDAMNVGAEGFSVYDNIYLGTYLSGTTTYDVPWMVLNENGFLLSKHVLDAAKFQASGKGYYPGSTLETALNKVYNNFSPMEQTAIKETIYSIDSLYYKEDLELLTNPEFQNFYKLLLELIDSGMQEFTAHLYPLSEQEMQELDGYYNDLFKTTHISQQPYRVGRWWLRTSSNDVDVSGVGTSDADMYGLSADDDLIGMRPACNLNKDAILFSSAAVGGKLSGAFGADVFNWVCTVTPTQWKLTLLDNSRSGFTATATQMTENSVTFTYTGAKTGSNEYVSAVIMDDKNRILYYGRIVNNSASGTARVQLPAAVTLGENATIKVFSEQYNGDNKTDYASELTELSNP